jgi:predicted AAA+ superfamily ATPase
MTEQKFYERELKNEIMKYLQEREAIIILGSRQVGKTTLMMMIMQEIKDHEKCFYIDLEDPKMLDIIEHGPQNFLEYLTQLGALTGSRNFVFLDEIHYMKNPSKFIKLMVDHYADRIKIICTGSSALGIKMKFHDALVGRKLIFNLYPLNFKEFVIFKNNKELANSLPASPFNKTDDPTRYFSDEYLRYFIEFMIFGGYPRVVLENNIEKKEKFLGEIVSAYIYKDIRSLFKIGDISKFNNLTRILASQTGALLNNSQIAKTVGVSRETVANYISILENSFLIYMVPPYSKSVHVEVRKANKVYWFDTGIRNYIIGDLSYSTSRSDFGLLLENVVFSGLIKRKKEKEHLYFWRTKDKTEVDLIYQVGEKVMPVEVKCLVRPHRGLINFMKRYNVTKGYVAHLGEFEKGKISSIPAFWLA